VNNDDEWLPRFENQAKRIACLFFKKDDVRFKFLWEMIARELQITFDEPTKNDCGGPEG